MTDLLALLQVLCHHHGGDQPELGMLEHHELGVGLEAVVGLVGERGAVAVLTLHRDGILAMILQCTVCTVSTWAHAGMSMVPRG